MFFYYIRFFNFRKECPLHLRSRFVYSLLAYRDRIDKGCNQASICATLPFGTRGINQSLAELVECGLVHKDEKGIYCALPPKPDLCKWFSAKKEPKEEQHWSMSYRGIRLDLPSKTNPLTGLGQVLYALIKDLLRQEAWITIKGLAKMLNVTEKSIKSNLEILEQRKLIAMITNNKGVQIDCHDIWDIPEEARDWWTKPKPKKEKVEETNTYMIAFWERCKALGATKSDIRRCKFVAAKLAEVYPSATGNSAHFYTDDFSGGQVVSWQERMFDALSQANTDSMRGLIKFLWRVYYNRKDYTDEYGHRWSLFVPTDKQEPA